MNKKRNTYILLAAVLGIWGLIGYRIIRTLNPKQELSSVADKSISFQPRELKKQETFMVSVHERDPFLGTITKPKKKTASKPLLQPKTPPQMEVPVYYAGMVKDDRSRERIFFVQIDGIQQLMHVNDEIKGVKLVRGNEQEITIVYNGKRKTIPIN
ncbi:hypothetical protein [Sinomicrobium weinanense]|uniref:Type II secretion system protein GspC N-terminal domain-containing protein n=1 Tax=Sinomicrobium weinanense TaxID=2842200 RepID=A0A926JP32_9FLAO|nr:hypothetical protein [Sinomicrobium weinanense]MBC9794703.1 hypothetical protein [Sinomicrobium weinanense]MBU3124188.1 hypothetical protein [Sinomicrobium weinanense]